ncbi:epimerase [Pseudomonas sp.]|uniref:epimerase n=1 Tax=Pseudomonas sp. TaxID=306 RepID=UPI0026347872|nr:epimerase [Pseudomonas sp.]
MKILIFGASGMVGSGVLRECLVAQDVESVRSISRTRLDVQHAKLEQVISPDFATAPHTLSDDDLRDVDACFFCLGVSAAGLTEEQYTNMTLRLTLAVAKRLCTLNPEATFIYISGAGADSTEQSSTMWARVRGMTENELLRLPFKRVHVLRPGVIQPLHGATSKTRSYRIFYRLTGPLLTMVRHVFPEKVLSTEIIGQSMLSIMRYGTADDVLESAQIYQLARRGKSGPGV